MATEVGVEAGDQDGFALFKGVDEKGDDERGEELTFVDADDLGLGEMGFEGVDVVRVEIEGVTEEAGAGLDLFGTGVGGRAEANGGNLLLFKDVQMPDELEGFAARHGAGKEREGTFLRERYGKHETRIKG